MHTRFLFLLVALSGVLVGVSAQRVAQLRGDRQHRHHEDVVAADKGNRNVMDLRKGGELRCY